MTRNLERLSFLELLDLVKKSERTVLDPKWVEDELLAIRVLGGAEAMLRLLRSGKKYTNDSGSSVAYLIGITDYAPTGPAAIINQGRVEPPDIDLDFEDARRDEVKEYLRRRWKNVTNISVFTKFSSRNLVRDISRAFAVPIDDVNRVCKQFEDIDTFLYSHDTKWFRDKYSEVVHLVKRFEGRWRQSGVHAAGVVVAGKMLTDILPLESRAQHGRERVPCAAYDMEDCAKVGLIKMDILSLEILTCIRECLDKIKERHGIEVNLQDIPLDDETVFRELSEGHTVGVFQAEAAPLTKLMKEMGVDSFADIVLATSLVRPGALLTVGDSCIRRKKGLEEITEIHPILTEITKDTYNLFIFQEQLIEALVKVGGFSWSDADKVRKIIGKKQDPEEFKKYEKRWLESASKTLGKTTSKKLWSDFEKFSGYAFNKAHATAYSLITYRCMWLKAHFPVEYMYALFKHETKREKLTTYYMEVKRLGIELLPPDVNKSDTSFSLEGDSIRYGLMNIKGVGAVAAEEIIANRPYQSVDDFIAKVARRKCTSAVVARLQEAGAFSEIGHPGDERKAYELLGIVDLDELDIPFETVGIGDIDGAGIVKAIVKEVKKYSDNTRITIEDQSGSMTVYVDSGVVDEDAVIIGLVCGNRLAGFTYLADYQQRKRAGLPLTPFERLCEGDIFSEDEKELYNHGIGKLTDAKALVAPLSVRTFKTRKGEYMARAIVTDGENVEDIVIFPSQYKKVAAWLQPYTKICIKTTRTDSGDLTLADDGLILASRILELKRGQDGRT
jgi:DNA polymerase-3 subunit alpha